MACLYSEARLYKGARAASLSQSTTPRSTGNISVSEESRPQQHMWNSKGFVLSRSNLLLHKNKIKTLKINILIQGADDKLGQFLDQDI